MWKANIGRHVPVVRVQEFDVFIDCMGGSRKEWEPRRSQT